MTKGLTRHRSVLGSGLGWGSYLGLLTLSVLLFVSWGGWMWHSTASDTHVGRFAVSYLTVLPLAALTLWVTGAFSWPRLTTAVGTLWAIKLVITAPLYFVFGPRGGMFGVTTPTARPTVAVSASARSAAPSAAKPSVDTPSSGYEAAAGAFAKGDIAGEVLLNGAKQPGAAVYLVAPRSGRDLEEASPTPIVITAEAFDRPLYLGFTGAELRADNRATTLRTLALLTASGGDSERNVPLPPRGKATFTIDKTGPFTLACRARGEQGDRQSLTAPLLIVDHPYAVLSDERGAFTLAEVPAGEVRVVALTPHRSGLLRTEQRLTVTSGERAVVQLQLSP